MVVVFWIIAIVFVLVGMALVLAPLVMTSSAGIDRNKLNVEVVKDKIAELKNDLSLETISQSQFEQAEKELEASLLYELDEVPAAMPGFSRQSNWQLMVILSVAVPVLAIGLYAMKGTSMTEVMLAKDKPRSTPGHQGMSPDQMLSELKTNLDKNPGDIGSWMMLARAYTYMRKPEQAEQTYKEGIVKTENNVQLRADYANYLTQTNRAGQAVKELEKIIAEKGETNADILSHYADALAMQKNSLSGKPYEIIKKALRLQPFHKKSLWLAGTAAFQEHDYKTALAYWDNLMQVLDPKSKDAQTLRQSIAEAKNQLGGGDMANAGTNAKAHPGGARAELSGTVTLADDLKAKAKPDDIVFLFAQATRGPRMPVAVERITVKDLPYTFKLDESKSMNEQLTLATVNQVVITARVAKSGDVMQRPGDLYGNSQPLAVGSSNINIEINHVASSAATPPPQPAITGGGASSRATPPSAAPVHTSISGEISLAEAVAAKASPGDTLFVYAKAAKGPRMPLAVIRKQVKDLPLKFTLDDSLSMSPAAKLSDFPDVIITALVSKSGTAMQQSGDLKGASPVVKVGSNALQIQIDSVVP